MVIWLRMRWKDGHYGSNQFFVGAAESPGGTPENSLTNLRLGRLRKILLVFLEHSGLKNIYSELFFYILLTFCNRFHSGGGGWRRKMPGFPSCPAPTIKNSVALVR
jgi:hypothetical protein